MNRWLKRVRTGAARARRSALVWRNRLRGYGYCVAGVRVPINRALLSSGMEDWISKGQNQAEEFACAGGLVHSGDVVLELGGGLGVLSAAIHREAAPSRIVSYEGNPDLLTYAKLTHQLNGASNIEVRHGVVLSRAETPTVPFYRHVDVAEGSLFRLPRSDLEAVKVPVVKLTELLAELVPNVLVVDIEGGELNLFEGAETLGSLDRIALELHPHIYGSAGVLSVFQALCRLGFAYDTNLSRGDNVALRRISSASAGSR
jgi:FkbM family methyltransferase